MNWASVRNVLFIVCLAAVAAYAMFDGFQSSVLGRNGCLSALTILLVLIVFIPPRYVSLAIPLAYCAVKALRLANYEKVKATGLPVTYLDAVIVFTNPAELAHAVGIKLPGAIINVLLLFAFATALAALLWFASLSIRGLFMRTAWLAVVLLTSVTALSASGRYVQKNIGQLFPDLKLRLWEAAPQQELFHVLGPLEYVAFTWASGDSTAFAIQKAHEDRPLPKEFQDAARQFLFGSGSAKHVLPNIVIVHAESTFDPNSVFAMEKSVRSALWDPVPDTKSVGKLRVNIVGGGSWVSEFEVLTGVAASGFGYQGFYTHQTIGPKVRTALPAFLRSRGYLTDAYYTEKADYMGTGLAFRNYGFERFHDSAELGLKSDWTDTDTTIVEKVAASGAFEPVDRPHLLFVMTQENHAPHGCVHFSSLSVMPTKFRDSDDFALNCTLNEYVRRAASTTAAIEAIVAQLRQLERLTGRPYVLMLYGDHQPYSMTEGAYDIAGGAATEPGQQSFQRVRRGVDQKITIYHIRSSMPNAAAFSFDYPLPITALPTLVSAFAARSWEEIYMPYNLLALQKCQENWSDETCSIGRDIKIWGQHDLLGHAD